jgi:hypothetical protein
MDGLNGPIDPSAEDAYRIHIAAPAASDRSENHVPTYSRVRPGALGYGWLGRTVITLTVLALAWITYQWFFPLVLLSRRWPIPAAAGFWGPIAYGIARVWRRARVG